MMPIIERLRAHCTEWVPVVLLIMVAINYSKAMSFHPITFGEPHLILNYSHGFIKRGFVGEIIHLIFGDNNSPAALSAFIKLHLLISAALACAYVGFIKHTRAADTCLWLIAGLCVGSQFWPAIAYTPGFLDVYLYLLLVMGLFALRAKQYGVAAAIAMISPLVHESALFVWTPFFVIFAWECWQQKRIEWKKAAVLIALIVSVGLVMLCHQQSAAEHLLFASRLRADVVQSMVDVQMGQTLRWTFHNMIEKWQLYYINGLISFLFFGWPTIAMLGIFAAMRKLRLQEFLVLLIAALVPLIILLFAWDLSRFIVYTVFSTSLVLAYWQQHYQPVRRESAWAYPVALLLIAILSMTPFIYCYFELALVQDDGVIPFANNAYGQWVQHYFLHHYTLHP